MAKLVKRHWKLMVGGSCLLIAIAFASGVLRVRCYSTDQPTPHGLTPMDERANADWRLEDGSSVRIARTYFTAAGKEATFHVEWEVPADALPPPQARDAMLELARPVLRHAIGSGELGRTQISGLGVGRVPVKRVRAQVQAAGTQQTRELVVSNMDELFVWNWTFNGRLHRIFAPGYYVDFDSGKVTFTMKWHDATLCPALEGIDDEAAFALAKPVLRRAVAWRLWQVVPEVSPDGISPPRTSVDLVGLELGCPEANCATGSPCGARGYRVSRTPEQIRASQD